MTDQPLGYRELPPGGKLSALRGFVGAMVDADAMRDRNRALAAKIVIDAALKLSVRLGAPSLSLLDVLDALEAREHGPLPEWIRSAIGGNHLTWEDRYPRALAVAVVERLHAGEIPYYKCYLRVAEACGLGKSERAAKKVQKWREQLDTYFLPEKFQKLRAHFCDKSVDEALATLRSEVGRAS